MSHLSLRENSYRRKHLAYVRHITLDPTGPGVVRIHMIPPHSQSPEDPYLLLLNGAQLVPLNFSWAVLLSEFMYCMEPYAGVEISADDWESMLEQAVRAVKKKVYPFVKAQILREDMGTLLRSLVAIARGQEPEVEVAPLSLGEYADKMSAPHRMDLMVSAMTRDGLWHCNQKCLHCYAAGQPMGEVKELDTAQWKELLQRLQAANIPQVTFTGGEPTLRSDLVELVNAAQWFVTRLNTNGRRLTADLCKALYEASLDSVQVTLYSDKAAVHNALVGVDGFGDTVAGIKNAVESGLIVSINTPLCSVNRDYADTLRFAASLGVRYATCSGLIPSGGATTEECSCAVLQRQQSGQTWRRQRGAGCRCISSKSPGRRLLFRSPPAYCWRGYTSRREGNVLRQVRNRRAWTAGQRHRRERTWTDRRYLPAYLIHCHPARTSR